MASAKSDFQKATLLRKFEEIRERSLNENVLLLREASNVSRVETVDPVRVMMKDIECLSLSKTVSTSSPTMIQVMTDTWGEVVSDAMLDMPDDVTAWSDGGSLSASLPLEYPRSIQRSTNSSNTTTDAREANYRKL